MNLKKQLKKLDIYDLKFICNEVGIKYNKKSSKQIIIRELLKPINKKYKYAMYDYSDDFDDSEDFDFNDYYNSTYELTEKGKKEIIEIENKLDFFDQFEDGRLELFQNRKTDDFLHIYGYLFKDLIYNKYIVRVYKSK